MTLPAGFSELEGFVDLWARDTTGERLYARNSSDMAAIRAFYNAATPRATEALEYCGEFPLHELPPDAATLFKLMLGLAQAAIAVEIHGQARAPGTPWPNTIVLERGTAPFG